MTRPAFISLGSNIRPAEHLPRAARSLAALGAPVRRSRAYRNPAVGPRPGPEFVNAAVLLPTALAPLELRARLREIEAALGRRRTADRFAPRTIDLDLCLLGDVRLAGPPLTLPDPEILTRAHLAVPLAELAPDFRHPVTAEPLSAVAARLAPAAQLDPVDDLPGFGPAADAPGDVALEGGGRR